MMAVVTLLVLGCGKGEDDDVKTPPTPVDNGGNGGSNNGQNANNSGENDSVQVICYTCYGSTKCSTCNGTGKGCKQCNGTGQYCDYCNSKGICLKCSGDGDCGYCLGKGTRTCNICAGDGQCNNCIGGKCKACNGKGWYYGYTSEIIHCKSCNTPGTNYSYGDGKCKYCKGTGRCSNNCKNGKIDCFYCNGSGHCDDCSGTGKCKRCKGTPKCDKCNGDGHCPDCKNSDGKCVTCGGTGYTMEKKGTPNPQDEYITPSSTSIEFIAAGESKTINVSANIEWTIASNTASSWLTVQKTSDYVPFIVLVLEAAPNGPSQNRSGIITLKGRSKSVEISVTQVAEEEILNISSDFESFSSNGESKELIVTANTSWSISSNTASSWLTATKKDDNTLLLEATPNSTNMNHYGIIEIKGANMTKTITVEQDKNQKAATITVNGVSFNMVPVEGGTFQMGGNDWFNNGPIHAVTVSSFSIGETEVTQALWFAVMGQKPTSNSTYKWEKYYGLGDNCPAYLISWDDCQEFIVKLNQKTGMNFRLPTEAEWEFAARGGIHSKGYLYAGSNAVNDVAWHDSNSHDGDYHRTPHNVRSKKANELGIYDMSGNILEWCSDWYDEYYYRSSPNVNPQGPVSGTERVMRGGSYSGFDIACKVTNRVGHGSKEAHYDTGLRLAMD